LVNPTDVEAVVMASWCGIPTGTNPRFDFITSSTRPGAAAVHYLPVRRSGRFVVALGIGHRSPLSIAWSTQHFDLRL
jgi:hypothetical protein